MIQIWKMKKQRRVVSILFRKHYRIEVRDDLGWKVRGRVREGIWKN